MENENQPSDVFFFFSEIVWINITRKNCPKFTKWKRIMKFYVVFGGGIQNQRK